MHISTSQNFRRTAGLTFSDFHDWCIEQSDSVPTCKQDASDYEENSPEYTYQRNKTVFFLENSTDFVFRKLPEEIQSKIVHFYSVINEYSLRSRDVYSTPSWHHLAPVVQTLDSAIHRINHYPADKY